MTLPVKCPAAMEVDPPAEGPSVVCGVLHLENQKEQRRHEIDPLISGRRQPRQVTFFCCGDGSRSGAACYSSCAIWRAAKDRDREGGDDVLRDGAANRVGLGLGTESLDGLDDRIGSALEQMGI